MAGVQNKQVFERAMTEVFGQGNLAAVEEFFSPDFKEHEEGPGKDRGREGLKEIVRSVRGGFPDLQVHVEAISEDGDQTWARVTFSGTNTGELMGHPATGRKATWTAIDQCRYREGKMIEHWGVVDLLSMMQQIGMVPPPQASWAAVSSATPLRALRSRQDLKGPVSLVHLVSAV